MLGRVPAGVTALTTLGSGGAGVSDTRPVNRTCFISSQTRFAHLGINNNVLLTTASGRPDLAPSVDIDVIAPVVSSIANITDILGRFLSLRYSIALAAAVTPRKTVTLKCFTDDGFRRSSSAFSASGRSSHGPCNPDKPESR